MAEISENRTADGDPERRLGTVYFEKWKRCWDECVRSHERVH